VGEGLLLVGFRKQQSGFVCLLRDLIVSALPPHGASKSGALLHAEATAVAAELQGLEQVPLQLMRHETNEAPLGASCP
jgi:hypothetical protein